MIKKSEAPRLRIAPRSLGHIQTSVEVVVPSAHSLAQVQIVHQTQYRQWFPAFSGLEMQERLATMPFELATLLQPRHVRMAIEIDSGWRYLRYLRQPPAIKQVLLSEMLQSRNISTEIAEVVARDRHRFAPLHFRPVAYMDRRLVVGQEAGLAAPSLFALMLAISCDLRPEALVCELGVGTGAHAACLARLRGDVFVTGVERNAAALRLAKANVERLGMSSRFKLLGEGDIEWAVASADFVYSTAGLSLLELARLTRYGRVGSTWLMPRQLTSAEFGLEPGTSWLRSTFDSYEAYCAGAWHRFGVLERFTLESGGHRQREALVEGVNFARYPDSGRIAAA